MKTEHEIRKQLEQIYDYRLSLRIERKTKKSCRNCKFGINKEFDLGDFGTVNRWECKDGMNYNDCNKFSCINSQQEIEKEMILDISDPAICGAKQPKIAILLWTLHESKKDNNTENDQNSSKTFFEKLKGLFK